MSELSYFLITQGGTGMYQIDFCVYANPHKKIRVLGFFIVYVNGVRDDLYHKIVQNVISLCSFA